MLQKLETFVSEKGPTFYIPIFKFQLCYDHLKCLTGAEGTGPAKEIIQGRTFIKA